MTILVDTDVLVAFINRREARHTEALGVMRKAFGGTWGAPAVTDFVIDEALTLLQARGAGMVAVDRVLSLVFEPIERGRPPLLPLQRVSDRALGDAVRHFRKHYRRGLSFTDCTTLAVAGERSVGQVASFDRGFDGLLARIAE